MNKLICLLVAFVPFITIAQDIDSPSEIRRETTYEVIGDYGQHIPALTSLIMIIAKKDKKGFWQFAKSYGTTYTQNQRCRNNQFKTRWSNALLFFK